MVVGAKDAPSEDFMDIPSLIGHLSLVPRFAGLVIPAIIRERFRE
jgi:hypothetical protein